MAELKPCPFCGGKAKFCINPHENSDTTQWHKIYCENVFECGAALGTALSPWDAHYEEEIDELYERWNRRAE